VTCLVAVSRMMNTIISHPNMKMIICKIEGVFHLRDALVSGTYLPLIEHIHNMYSLPNDEPSNQCEISRVVCTSDTLDEYSAVIPAIS
jgi:hypothetical protein